MKSNPEDFGAHSPCNARETQDLGPVGRCWGGPITSPEPVSGVSALEGAEASWTGAKSILHPSTGLCGGKPEPWSLLFIFVFILPGRNSRFVEFYSLEPVIPLLSPTSFAPGWWPPWGVRGPAKARQKIAFFIPLFDLGWLQPRGKLLPAQNSGLSK